jgi:hypothetical protein
MLFISCINWHIYSYGCKTCHLTLKQDVLGRTNRLLSLIRHGPHWKQRVQQFFYCCVSILYRGNFPTELLPSNDTVIFTEPLPNNDGGNTLSLIRHRPHWKQRVQKFFYWCVCIRYRGNFSTEPLDSNDRGSFTEPLHSNDRGIFTGPSRCLATIRWFLSSLVTIGRVLPSRCIATIGGIHTHTDNNGND